MRKLLTVIIFSFISLNSFSQTLLSENFEAVAFPPTGWALVNAGSGNNWIRSTATSSPVQFSGSTAYMAYNYSSSAAANAWAFTPGLTLTAGTQYVVQFVEAASGFTEKLKVTIGNGQTVAAQTTTLLSFTDATSGVYTTRTKSFSVPISGTYNLGFNCFSAADQFNFVVDEINVHVASVPGAAPTSFSATTVTQTNTTVGWTDASTNETAFRVYRSEDNINFIQVGADIPSTSTATTGTIYSLPQTGQLSPGITYFYRVAAVLEGESSYLTGSQATLAANTYFYVGAATGDFGTAANWNTLANNTGTSRTSPASTDILVVDGAGTTAGAAVTLTMAADASIGGLQISSSTPVTLQSINTTTRTLTITGSAGNELDIPAGSSLILNNATQAAAISFSTGTGMTGNIAGTLTFGGSASNTLTTTGGTGTLVTVQSTGIVNLTNNTVSLVGSAATLSFADGSNCNASGATTTGAPVPLATWGNTSNLTISGLTSSTTAPANNEQSFGNLIINCTAATGNMAFFAGTNLGVIKGDLNITATNTGRLRLLGAGTLTINGNINATAGNLDLTNGAANISVLGNVNVSNAAKCNFANGAGIVNIGGNVIVSNTASINIGNAATTSTTTITGNLTLNSSGTSAFALTSSTTLALNLGGSFSITNGTFAMGTGTGSGTFKVKGNFSQSGAGVVGLAGTGTAAILEFNGTSSQNVSFTTPMTGLISVRLNNPAGINLTGTLAINSGATYTVSAGSTTGSGTLSYNATSTKLIYNGSAGSQTATSQEFPASNGPLSLTISNSSPAPNNLVTIPFSRSLGAAGILAFTAGILDNTGNVLTIPNTITGAITGASSTSYIKGALIRSLPAGLASGSTYTFPVGKSIYNPFELVNPTTNAGGTVSVQAEVIDANANGTAGTLMSTLNTSRYWTASITNGSGNFTNSLIRLNDTRGTQDGIAASAILTGTYNHIGGAVSTLAAGAITTTAPAVTSLPGFFVMGNLSGPVLSGLSITPSGNQCTNVSRSVTVTVTPGAGAITTVTLNYQVNAGSVQSVTMTNPSGNNWTGTIPTVTPPNATVTWSVTATDANTITGTTTGTSYADVPLSGTTAVATASSLSVCSGSTAVLTASLSRPSTAQVGTGTSTAGSGSGAFNNGRNFYGSFWGNARQEWLVRASEMTALGFTAGNISALSISVVATGSPTTLNGFTIKLANTSETTLTTAYTIATLTTVWGPANYTPVVGTNTHTFTTAFNWDGVSNIVVEVCHANLATGSSGATNSYTVPGFNCGLNYGVDGSIADICSTTSVLNSSLASRPNILLTANSAPAVTSASWSDGSTTVGTSNPQTVNPTGNTSYSATVTSLGCSLVSNTVTINTLALPPSPNPNNSVQCGTAVPAAFVTSGGGGGGFKWYDAQTGGNLLQTGGAAYTTAISSTTHFWVSESNGTCESARVEVIASVNPPDAVQASVDINNPCSNITIQLTATVTGNANANTYNYTWTAAPEPGSGISGSQSGGTGTFGTPASTSVTPTAAGTYTYTVTGVDGSCTTTSQVVVTVKALPVLNTPVANPATVCAGVASNLTASTSTIATGTVTMGAGAITTINNSNSSTTYNSPFSHYWGGYKAQYLIKASELTAQNLVAGNLTSLAFDITTAGITYNGFAMNIAQTASTALTTTFINTGFTQVFSGNLAVTGTGLKTITFSTPFNWDGTSNIVVQLCWSNNNTGGTGAEVKTDNTAFVATAQFHNDSQSPATICGTTTASGTLSERPKMVIGGQLITSGPGSLTYNWQPGSLSGSSTSVSPSATTVYTVTATDPSTTCFNTATLTVTVNPLPPAPSGSNGTDQCGTALTDASVSSNNSTDPQSPAFFKWYLVPTGGSAVQSGTSTTYQSPISATTTFYVAEVSANGCEGPRATTTTVVSDPDPITVTATQVTVCIGGSSDISAAYTPNFNSFASFDLTATGGTASGVTGTVSLSPNGAGDGTDPYTITPTATGTYTYTITAIDPDKGCIATNSVVVTVGALPTITSVTATPSSVCAGGAVTLTGQSIIATSGTVTLGTGSTTTSTTGVTPFSALYEGAREQYLVRASELTALGLTTGNLTSLSFNVTAAGSFTQSGFNIKIAHTANTALSGSGYGTPSGSFVTVYGPVALTTPATGLKTFTFTTPFAWDGVSNILVDICHDNDINASCPSCFGGNSTVSYTNTAYNAVYGSYADNIQSCGTTATNVISTFTNRPNMVFGGQVGSNQAALFNWQWNPGALNGSTVTVHPTSTTTYTATASDPATGCSVNSLPVTVTVVPVTANATATPNTAVCAGTAVTLNGGATGGGPFTYSWSDGTVVVGTTSPLTVNPTVTTTYTVTVTDNCNNTTTSSVTVNINPQPTASIVEAGPISICAPATQVLTASTNAASPSYQWQLNGTNIPAATASTYTVTGSGSYTVVVTNTATGCVSAASAAVVVTINVKPSAVIVTPATTTICNGAIVSLTASISTVSATSGTGTSTSNGNATGAALGPNPFQIYYGGDKQQSLYLASELTALGMGAGSVISAVKFNLPTADNTLALASLRIKMKNTTTSSLTTTWEPSMTIVRTAAAFTPAAGINTIPLNTNFIWDGISNLVVEVTYSNNNTGTTGTVFNTAKYSPTSFSSTIFYRDDSGTPASFNNYTGAPSFSYNSRNDMTFDFSNPAVSATWSPATGLYTNAGATTAYTGTSAASLFAKPTTTTTYTVTATSAAGCTNTGTSIVTVNPRPTGVITGGATYCAGQGSTATTLSIAVTGAGPWSGTLSPGAVPFSGSSSPITVSVTPSSTTTYTIATLNGSQCSSIAADLTGSATVTINPTPATPTITPAGPITQCGGTVTLTASSPGAWQWNLEGSPIGGATNQTLVVSASGNYSVTVTNEFGCSATSAATSVTINPVPATPTISAGGPTTFCAGGSVTLTSSSATNNQWNLNGSPIGGATNSTLVVTASGDYTVTVTNGFGCSATSAITTVTVNPLSANPTATVVQPTCALATGTINVTAPLGAGNTYSIGGPFQGSPSFPGVSPGTYTVYVQNSFGCFSPATVNVTVNPQPFIPGAPVVSGIVNVCPYVGVAGAAGQVTYTATATGNGTQTFNWVVPPTNVTIVSGQGTPTLVLSFQNGFATQANKQIRLTVTNQCGTGPMTVYYLAAQIPNTPAPIAGPTDACPLLNGPAVTYTIPSAPGAASYIWNVPATGTTVTHPNGTNNPNDTTITVAFSTAWTTGTITVQSKNDCGLSGLRSITVTRIAPSQPNIISGPTSACPYITPNAPATYTVPAVPGVTYTWSGSNGAIMNSAQGSNTMSVTYPIGYTGGTISVTATTGCGTSVPRNLTITTLNPATPGVPDVIQTHFCGEAGGRIFTYTLASYPSNATSIVWTVPTAAGAILVSGQNSTSITVSYPDAAVSGVITVQAVNPCANSVTRSVNVKLPACPTSFAGTNNGTNGTAESKGPVVANTIPVREARTGATLEVKIFPNPTVSDFKLEVLTSGTEEITVRVLDNLGRLYKNFKVMPYQTIALGAELKAGSYLVEVRQGKTVKTTKVIKF